MFLSWSPLFFQWIASWVLSHRSMVVVWVSFFVRILLLLRCVICCWVLSLVLTSGFVRFHFRIDLRASNILSTLNCMNAVTVALVEELARGHIYVPVLHPLFRHLHCFPLVASLIPDGRVHLILYLSSHGSLVNNCISQDEFVCRYSRFGWCSFFRFTVKCGCVYGLDWYLSFVPIVSGTTWSVASAVWYDRYFVDTRLPFAFSQFAFHFSHICSCINLDF